MWSRVICDELQRNNCTLGDLIARGVCDKAQAESVRHALVPVLTKSADTTEKFSLNSDVVVKTWPDIHVDPKCKTVWVLALRSIAGWGAKYRTYVLGGKGKKKKLKDDVYCLGFNRTHFC